MAAILVFSCVREIYPLNKDSWTFSYWYMRTVKIKHKTLSNRKLGDFIYCCIPSKYFCTCSSESQNGPCLVCPACTVICIKTKLRTTQRRNRKSSDLGKACAGCCYWPDSHLATRQPMTNRKLHVGPTHFRPLLKLKEPCTCVLSHWNCSRCRTGIAAT